MVGPDRDRQVPHKQPLCQPRERTIQSPLKHLTLASTWPKRNFVVAAQQQVRRARPIGPANGYLTVPANHAMHVQMRLTHSSSLSE